MPIDPKAAIEITAFSWVPPFAYGLVRDLRVRWALEEAGLPYSTRLFRGDEARPESYLRVQPFDQVPAYSDGTVQMFETGAIVLHISENCETLLPTDPQGRARATSWVIASLNSVEPSVQQLLSLDLFYADEPWAAGQRPVVEAMVRQKLKRVAAWLGDREYLEDRFTAGDLMMTTVLRILGSTDLINEQPRLAAYQARCEARPAFARALAAQMEPFEAVPA